MVALTRTPWNQPFSATSPWNIGIGSGAQWESSSNPIVQKLDSLNGAINTTDWSLPIYTGTGSDPLVTVTTTDGELGPVQIHIPANAVPSGGSDRNMSFFDETQPGRVWTFWDVTFNNGSNASGGLTAGTGSVFDTAGDGFTNPSYNPNQVGSNYVGGVITPYDLSQGSIDHMLRVALSPEDEAMPPGATWDTGTLFPTTHTDYDGPRGEYTGIIPAGSTFGIPASVNLSSLGLSQGGLMLAQALQKYGAVWADSAGTNQFTIYSEPSTASNQLMQQMEADVRKLMPYLSVMSNQRASNVNGGGTYPAPPPPFDPSLGIGTGEAPGYPGSGSTPPPPSPTHTLTLLISEDAYKGDAQFQVSVDGTQVGGTQTAHTLHSSGDYEEVQLTGNWNAGAHTVQIAFINDAYGGTSSTDRNLYLGGIAYDGTSYANTSAALYSNGSRSFTVGGSAGSTAAPSPVLTLNLSEDAYQGDAQFTVSVDGKTISSPQSVTTLHSSGSSEAFAFTGLSAGKHDIGVTFTNDAYGGSATTDRNLYVNSISFGQNQYAGASLFTNSTQHFSVST